MALARSLSSRGRMFRSCEGLLSCVSGKAPLPGCSIERRIHGSAASEVPPQAGGYLRTGWGEQSDRSSERILVTGASGQIGGEFVPFLRERFGCDRVVASDVRNNRTLAEEGPFVYCDVQDKDNLARILLENGITTIVHLATLLSAIGEKNPRLALKVNTHGIQNILDLAATNEIKVYSPSTIAVFGPTTPRHDTPDSTVKEPKTMYGITKVHQELLGDYYAAKLGVDYRSLRYPGIISSKSLPGGGTTDYAVDIFHAALKYGRYDCFLDDHASLPMMYMPDCLEGTLQVMAAPKESLTHRTYNVTSMSFTPAELAASIRKFIPGFEMRSVPDFRNDIAQSWPASIDDSLARRDWGWKPKFDLDAMTSDMLNKISNRLAAEQNAVKAQEASMMA